MSVCVQHDVCVAYVHMFLLVPIFGPVDFEKSQVTFLPMAKVRVRVTPSLLTGLSEDRRRRRRRVSALLGFFRGFG